MGPYIRPCVGVVNKISVCVYVEGGLLGATLDFCVKCIDPQGVFEHLDQVDGNVALIFSHHGYQVLKELGGCFVVPGFPHAFFDLFCAVGTEALDGEEEVWAVHFWGCYSEGYVLGGPDGLLHKDLVVDFAQAVDEERGGEAFFGLLLFLSCALATLFGY